jgi:hypothetical protein
MRKKIHLRDTKIYIYITMNNINTPLYKHDTIKDVTVRHNTIKYEMVLKETITTLMHL